MEFLQTHVTSHRVQHRKRSPETDPFIRMREPTCTHFLESADAADRLLHATDLRISP